MKNGRFPRRGSARCDFGFDFGFECRRCSARRPIERVAPEQRGTQVSLCPFDVLFRRPGDEVLCEEPRRANAGERSGLDAFDLVDIELHAREGAAPFGFGNERPRLPPDDDQGRGTVGVVPRIPSLGILGVEKPRNPKQGKGCAAFDNFLLVAMDQSCSSTIGDSASWSEPNRVPRHLASS